MNEEQQKPPQTAQELAQYAIGYAFSLPGEGWSDEKLVPVGLVPYTMDNLEDIAVSMLTNGPGWFNGDSPLYDEGNDTAAPFPEVVAPAVAMVQDYFTRCKNNV